MALATANLDGVPEVATVEYVLDGDRIIFNTLIKYRKYPNLLNNPRVACAITTAHEQTLQIDGTAIELNGQDAQHARELLLAADPDFAAFFSEDTRFFAITPSYMRLRDYTQTPMQTTELRSQHIGATSQQLV